MSALSRVLREDTLAAAGVILVVMGVILSLANVTLSLTKTENYYYYKTGLTYTKMDFNETDSGSTVSLNVGSFEFKITPVYPANVTGTLTVMVSTPLTAQQVMALGASDPKVLGSVFLLFDMIVYNATTTGNVSVTVDIQVPRSDAKIYYWDNTSKAWTPYPGQQLVYSGGKVYVRLNVAQPLTGTLFASASPAAVGGLLVAPTPSHTSWAGIALAAVGAALIAASVGLTLRRRARKS